MQMLSPTPLIDESASTKLWRSRSLPANSSTSPAILTRASSTGHQLSSTNALFGSIKAFRPSALLERRKRVNPGLRVEAFNSQPASPPPPPPPAAAAPRTPRSPYEVLQISPFASQDDIKTAYWRSARKHHPDKVPLQHREASTLLFLEIHSAYSTLKDPHSRARYDLQMSLQSFQSSGYHSSSPAASPRPYTAPYPQPSSPSTYRYTPRAHQSTSSSYRNTPRAQCAASPSSNAYTPRSPYSIGRSWETDQCW